MKITGYEYPKSSFLSIDKDMSIIIDYILKNDRLKKLLYYTTKDCLSKEPLTDEQSNALFGRQIKIVPKLEIDSDVLNYILISFDNFSQNYTNPEFRDNVIEFDIVCHIDQWHLTDFQLRPYKIAAELDSMFDKQKFSGIGRLEFINAHQILLSPEYMGICLMYQTIHGGEDEVKAPKESDNLDIISNFDKIFNK